MLINEKFFNLSMRGIHRWIDRFHDKQADYAIVTLLFRGLLGVTYMSVFLSLLFQVKELITSKGVLPIATILANNPQSIWSFPTLHVIASSDIAIYLFLFIGLLFAALFTLGVYPRTSLAISMIVYLSYVTSGLNFFYFQWDNLLLEVSFLALCLPLANRIWQKKFLESPSIFLVFLFRWLAFRLYFESGIAKLLYGQGTWHTLQAMTYYYETAPLPSFGGWMAQQLLPHWAHVATLLMVLFVELGIILLVFWPRKGRIAAFYSILAINLVIGFTSNFGFFNLLAVVVSLFFLDDQHVLGMIRFKDRFKHIKIYDPTRKGAYIAIALAIIIVPFSAVEFYQFTNRSAEMGSVIQGVQEIYRPYRFINRYHLFPGVVKDRYVLIAMQSEDKTAWEPIYLKYTPQDPTQKPPWLPLHQARFAFLYSFMPSNIDQAWFQNYINKLCTSPEDLQDLFVEPIEKKRYLRFDMYTYKFSSVEQLNEGIWWTRNLIQSTPTIDCEVRT